MQKIASDIAKMHEGTIKESAFSLSLLQCDIIETLALLPRYHLNALTKLIKKGAFADGGAEEKAFAKENHVQFTSLLFSDPRV